MDDIKLAYDQSVTTLTEAGQGFEIIQRRIGDTDYAVYKKCATISAGCVSRSSGAWRQRVSRI